MLQNLPPVDVAILCDFRASIQRLRWPDTTDTATRVARILSQQLLARIQQVTLQWVPSHVGLTDSEHADSQPDMAHTVNKVVSTVPDPR